MPPVSTFLYFSLYHKYVKVIDEVIEEINRVKRRNDILVAEIMKLRNERDN